MAAAAARAGALFNNSGLVAFSAYVLGIASVIVTGIILKKFKTLSGDAMAFVMELPAYHIPTVKNVWHSIYDRLKAFAKKAVTVYMAASIIVWFLSSFGWTNGSFGMVEDLADSLAHSIGVTFAWIFTPCGFNKWQAVIASLLGIAAKEEVVGVLGVFSAIGDADMAMEMVEERANLSPIAALFDGSAIAGYAFMAFNLLCAPCFAAINTICAEMKSAKWSAFAIGYQCGFAYLVATMIYQLGTLFTGGGFTVWTAVAFVILAAFLYLLFRPGYKPANEGKKAAAAAR